METKDDYHVKLLLTYNDLCIQTTILVESTCNREVFYRFKAKRYKQQLKAKDQEIAILTAELGKLKQEFAANRASLPMSANTVSRETDLPVHFNTPSLGDDTFQMQTEKPATMRDLHNYGKISITHEVDRENEVEKGTGRFVFSETQESHCKLHRSTEVFPVVLPMINPDTHPSVSNSVKSTKLQPSQSPPRKQPVMTPHPPSTQPPHFSPPIAELEAAMKAVTTRPIIPVKSDTFIFKPSFLNSQKYKKRRFTSPVSDRNRSRPRTNQNKLPKGFLSCRKMTNTEETTSLFPSKCALIGSPHPVNRPRSRSSQAQLALLSHSDGRYKVTDYPGAGPVRVVEVKDWSMSVLDEAVMCGFYEFNYERDGKVMSESEVSGVMRLIEDGQELPPNAHIRALRTFKRLRSELFLPIDSTAITNSTSILLTECTHLLRLRHATTSVLHYLHELEALLLTSNTLRIDLTSQQLQTAVQLWKSLYPYSTTFRYNNREVG